MPQPLPRETDTIIEAIDKFIEIKKLSGMFMRGSEAHALMRSVWELVDLVNEDLDKITIAAEAEGDDEEEEVGH